ncbi:centromere protein X isoform X1 [Oryx dammah]|uniref:centromere protein X isoform X1 n=1 Tax=Oryx dammah TaxID=59534 RepID=UPI001A9B3BDF|nr:centromere protein X isoform X1 [Oryx dammah]
MEETGAVFRKELVSKLLHLHFKDKKTKVSGDALQLMAELLKIFVVGEQRDPISVLWVPPRLVWTIRDPFTFFSEAIKTPFSRFPTSTLSLKISVFQKPQPQSSELSPGTGVGEQPGLWPRGVGAQGPPPTAFSTLLPPAIMAEAAIRSVRQAQAEGLARVDVDQLEKVLPQLLLDF